MRHFALRAAAVLALSFAALAPAHAGFISTTSGNDCAGVFGGSFGACTVPADPANGIPSASPIIIKINFGDDGSVGVVEINSALFPTVDGSEFSFSFGAGGTGTGTWTYTPGAGDPAILAFVAKGGSSFNLFSTLGVYTDVAYFTPDNGSGGPAGLSHMSFYDTGMVRLPEPGTLMMLGLGLVAMAFIYRRRRSR
jgi:hypothetical protein